MADRITEERLRKILERKLYFGLDEGQAIAAELLEARNKIRADEEHLPTIASLTQDLHETEQELATARAEVASLREGQEELARAVKFLDMCNKERIASGDTGAMSDAWQWVEEAAREMIDAAKETP